MTGSWTRNAHWLDEFALFVVLKRRQEFRPWNLWPRELKMREAEAIARARESLADELEKGTVSPVPFFQAMGRPQGLLRREGIRIVGDIPNLCELRQRRRLGSAGDLSN